MNLKTALKTKACIRGKVYPWELSKTEKAWDSSYKCKKCYEQCKDKEKPNLSTLESAENQSCWIFKRAKDEGLITFKGAIRLIVYIFLEIMESRKQWNDILSMLKENNYSDLSTQWNYPFGRKQNSVKHYPSNKKTNTFLKIKYEKETFSN